MSVTVDYRSLNEAQVEAENDPFTAPRYEQFARHLPGHAVRVLDAGCSVGAGGAALLRIRPDLELIGLDLLGDRLARLPVGIYRGTICAMADRVPLGDGALDAIVAGEFIEHLTYADVLVTLREFLRVLRVGGRLLLTTPNPDSLRIVLTRGTMLGGPHVSAHYPKQLAQMLAEVGFGPASWCGSGKASRVLGERFPLLAPYGSYLIRADKLG